MVGKLETGLVGCIIFRFRSLVPTPTLDSQSLQSETRVSIAAVGMGGGPRPAHDNVVDSYLRRDRMPGIPQRDEAPAGPEPSAFAASEPTAGENQPAAVGEKPKASPQLEEAELEAALQLLVERAQYITGATGTALALPQAGEMVCRASAGSCAPSVGARLQVRSGLTGESIARRQLLRCDNAETDPRVNLETCRALGIASIVVLPMLRRNGEVRGLFELFSDHPYAFEERDLIALERMADLTLTALDLAEQRHGAIPPARPAKPSSTRAGEKTPLTGGPVLPANALPASVLPAGVLRPNNVLSAQPVIAPSAVPAVAPAGDAERSGVPVEVPEPGSRPGGAESVASLSANPTEAVETPLATVVPEAMRKVQKCASCGFPVSEGRTLCLDCEKKQGERGDRGQGAAQTRTKSDESGEARGPSLDENLPAFLANAAPFKESWLSNHVNLLAILVIILGVLVAIVVFR
jgi:putative methionine-R-sulfoxide reductase with GAF domain